MHVELWKTRLKYWYKKMYGTVKGRRILAVLIFIQAILFAGFLPKTPLLLPTIAMCILWVWKSKNDMEW